MTYGELHKWWKDHGQKVTVKSPAHRRSVHAFLEKLRQYFNSQVGQRMHSAASSQATMFLQALSESKEPVTAESVRTFLSLEMSAGNADQLTKSLFAKLGWKPAAAAAAGKEQHAEGQSHTFGDLLEGLLLNKAWISKDVFSAIPSGITW